MYFNYKENKIYYEKYGNKKQNLIILPGWGDNRKTFYNIIDNLKDEFSIYIFDYPGFGKSPLPKQDLTIYNYAEIIIEFMKQNKIKNPIVIGHSFGGRIIVTMSGYYNINFKKIILISSAGIKPKKNIFQKIKQYSYKLLKKLGRLLPLKTRNKYNKKLISIFASSDYKALPPTLHRTFIKIVNEDLTKYLKYINNETLLIWGEKDQATPIKDAYKMNYLIKNSGLVIIKNATHFCYMEYPMYFKIILNKYLKGED